ncbi:putative transaldolase [Xylaria bambusicola]|uniref:putative transaldolase n=1 Tax=Xylaria bambusicola TaxID=326684 RepID=UPI002007FAF6|nr:putative transaldolase [Xylaria bambusicola]KAI0509370.1 putative transaldolase [Xylaria bambusicola]
MSSTSQNLLDLLRTLSTVDCDTLDVEVAKQLGPFVDCTSNQAIAYNELTKTDVEDNLINQRLITDSIAYAKSKTNDFADVDVKEVAVEAATVKLAHSIAPYLTGYSHVQTNPKYSFDTQKTLANALRFVAISRDLDPGFDVKRLCVKIPTTWEGVQACKELEKQGIATLATAVNSIPQSILASNFGCTYIGLYINDLRVHFDASYVDENKGFHVGNSAQRFYGKHGQRTQVLAASLTSIQEVMMLAGVAHITVSPPLLYELSKTPANTWKGDVGSVFKTASSEAQDIDAVNTEDESTWRLAFSKDKDGKSETKLNDAISLFTDKQDALESLIASYL